MTVQMNLLMRSIILAVILVIVKSSAENTTNITGVKATLGKPFNVKTRKIYATRTPYLSQLVTTAHKNVAHIDSDLVRATSRDTNSMSGNAIQTIGQTTSLSLETLKWLLMMSGNLASGFNRAVDWMYNPFENVLNWLGDLNFLTPANVSVSCKRDLKALIADLKNVDNVERWSLQMIDASAKPPAGIERNSLFWLGNFDLCVNIEVKEQMLANSNGVSDNNPISSTQFVGEYCIVDIYKTIYISDVDKQQMVDNIKHVKPPANLHYGVCFPSSCSINDKQLLLNYYTSYFSPVFMINETFCQTSKQKSMDSVAYMLTLVLLIPLFLVIIATVYHYWNPEEDFQSLATSQKKDFRKSVIQIFSARNSYESLFSTSHDKSALSGLYGIRAILCMGVLWVHVHWMQLDKFPWRNLLDHHQYRNYPFIHLVGHSFLIVNAFFFISGFCLTHFSIARFRRQNENPLIIFSNLLMRYLKLTIPYFYVMAFNAGPLIYTMSGPLWPNVATNQNHCRNYWWRRLIYAENIFRGDTFSIENDCVTEEWYLSAYMQLHLLGFPLIWLLVRKPRLSTVFIFIIIVTSVITTGMTLGMSGVKIMNSHLPLNVFPRLLSKRSMEVTAEMLKASWPRAAGFGVGMLLGFYVDRIGKNGKVSILYSLFGWLTVTITLTAMKIIGNQYFDDLDMSPSLQVFYGTVCNLLLLASLGWFLVHCIYQPKGWINTLLSHDVLMVLGKLAYSVYLVQLSIWLIYFGSVKDEEDSSYYRRLRDFTVLTPMCLSAAVMLYFMVESPLDRFLKLLRTNSPSVLKTSGARIDVISVP